MDLSQKSVISPRYLWLFLLLLDYLLLFYINLTVLNHQVYVSCLSILLACWQGDWQIKLPSVALCPRCWCTWQTTHLSPELFSMPTVVFPRSSTCRSPSPFQLPISLLLKKTHGCCPQLCPWPATLLRYFLLLIIWSMIMAVIMNRWLPPWEHPDLSWLLQKDI